METIKDNYISVSLEVLVADLQGILCSSPGGNEEPVDTDLVM